MMAYLPQLDESDVTRAISAQHALWGGARSPEDHLAHRREAISRSDGTVSLAGLRVGDDLVCSLERRSVTLATPHGDLDAVGIGRVHTREEHRGAGHAKSLITHVMAESSAALVFSDLAPAFYEELGFAALSSVEWTARTEALPMVPGRLEPTRDIERLVEIYDASWREGWLRMKRTVTSWAYAAWRRQAGDAFLVGENDYMLARCEQGILWIDDVATTEIGRDALWGSMRTLASAMGAEHVRGWLRPDHGGGPFVATGRKRCIPMLATRAPLGDVRSHFALLDTL